MKITLGWPDERAVRGFLAATATVPLSYPEVGATRAGDPVPGYDNDRNRVCLGEGEAIFQAACDSLRHWRQFPQHWVRIQPDTAAPKAGKRVAMVARAFGVTFVNAAEVVYTLDEPRRFGFAYGTTTAHVECGEERFLVEWLPDNTVWYELCAFSRPRHWLIRLGYPLARRLQRRFVRDSQAALQRDHGHGDRA